ncbi:MAG: hypothetical protein R3F43_18980 [bacterium]
MGNIAFDRTTNAGAETWLASVARHDAAAGQYHSLQAGVAGAWRTLSDAALDKKQTTYNHAVSLIRPTRGWLGRHGQLLHRHRLRHRVAAHVDPGSGQPVQHPRRPARADRRRRPGQRDAYAHVRRHDGGLYHTDNGGA